MARPSQMYNSQDRIIDKTKYKFPILSTKELVSLYNTMGFDITESILVKPNSPFMKAFMEQVLDKFLYISPYLLKEKVSKMEQDSDQVSDDSNDLNSNLNEYNRGKANESYRNDTRQSINIVAMQRIMYKFLCDCGVEDFSIRDVIKPELERLRIILSALINYARFREERMGDLDELMDTNDQMLEEYKESIRKHRELEVQIEEVNLRLQSQQYTLDELYAKNEPLEDELRRLKGILKDISETHERCKSERQSLIRQLEEQRNLHKEAEKDLEQIRPYIKESPESVKELIKKMKESELREVGSLEKSEQQLRNVNVSLDSFHVILQELSLLESLMEEIIAEADKNRMSENKLKSLKNELLTTTDNVKELERSIKQKEKQLIHNEEKLEALQNIYKDKIKSLEDKMNSKMIKFSDIKSKRNIEDVELSAKESQVKDWEHKMSQLQRQFDSECKEANFEFEKLNSKVTLYMKELKNKIRDSKDLLSM